MGGIVGNLGMVTEAINSFIRLYPQNASHSCRTTPMLCGSFLRLPSWQASTLRTKRSEAARIFFGTVFLPNPPITNRNQIYEAKRRAHFVTGCRVFLNVSRPSAGTSLVGKGLAGVGRQLEVQWLANSMRKNLC